jgi:hypothetical protein
VHSGESFTFISNMPVIRMVSPEVLRKTHSEAFSMSRMMASSGIVDRYSSEMKLAEAPVSISANLLMLWNTTGTRRNCTICV